VWWGLGTGVAPSFHHPCLLEPVQASAAGATGTKCHPQVEGAFGRKPELEQDWEPGLVGLLLRGKEREGERGEVGARVSATQGQPTHHPPQCQRVNPAGCSGSTQLLWSRKWRPGRVRGETRLASQPVISQFIHPTNIGLLLCHACVFWTLVLQQ
jgi:hypothetical protein